MSHSMREPETAYPGSPAWVSSTGLDAGRNGPRAATSSAV